MICPNCTQPMEEVPAGGVTVDVCAHGCGGMFFDYGELETAGYERLEDPWALNVSAVVSARYKDRLQCPKCGQDMDSRRLGKDIEAVVDVCSRCSGLWLDHGEFDAICRAVDLGADMPDTDKNYKKTEGDIAPDYNYRFDQVISLLEVFGIGIFRAIIRM